MIRLVHGYSTNTGPRVSSVSFTCVLISFRSVYQDAMARWNTEENDLLELRAQQILAMQRVSPDHVRS